MLIVFSGDNIIALEDAFAQASKGATRLNTETLLEGELDEYARHNSLFSAEQFFSLRELPDSAITLLQKSPNTFFVFFPLLGAEMCKLLTKSGARVEKFDYSKSEKARNDKAKKDEQNKIFRIDERRPSD